MKKRRILIACLSIAVLALIISIIFIRRDPDNDVPKVSDNPLDNQRVYLDTLSENPLDYQRVYLDTPREKSFQFYFGEESTVRVIYNQYTDTEQELEYNLDLDTAKKLQQLICDYCKVIAKDEDRYWPNTEEYPAMLVLWDAEFRNEDSSFLYTTSGALEFPENWDEFMLEIESYLN